MRAAQPATASKFCVHVFDGDRMRMERRESRVQADERVQTSGTRAGANSMTSEWVGREVCKVIQDGLAHRVGTSLHST